MPDRADRQSPPEPEQTEPVVGASRRLAEIAANARPAEVSEWSKAKLLDDWEKASNYIRAAEQMRIDGIKHQALCAERIVRKLGTGMFRYKDKLYMASISKKGVVYFREARARKNG